MTCNKEVNDITFCPYCGALVNNKSNSIFDKNLPLTPIIKVYEDTTVKDDGTIELKFSENPSTGFEIHYRVTPSDILELVKDNYISKNTSDGLVMTGVGGTRIISFRPLKDGKVDINFISARIDHVQFNFIFTYEIKDGVITRIFNENK